MEKLTNCPNCGSANLQPYLKAKDNYSSEEFEIVQCEDCGFIFTNPRPDAAEIGKYYSSPDYMSHQSYRAGFVQTIYRLARKYMMRRKLELIQILVGKKKDFWLLDYGCGTGDFLGFMKRHNIHAEGIEPDVDARAVAKSVNHVDTYSVEAAADLPAAKYDVITLWHVLEHVHELHKQLDYFQKWLKPDGKLLIAVPNIESFDARKYGPYWDALDVPRHIYHYSPKSIREIVVQHNFRIEKQYPLHLDAYYVSMRSEWHKGTAKWLSFIKAILSGWKSNSEAGRTGNYSSLIYVFAKRELLP